MKQSNQERLDHLHARRPTGGLTGGLFGPIVATLIPIAAAAAAYFLIGRVGEVHDDRELPALTAWMFEHRLLAAMMLLPAAICGLLGAFVQRRYLLYGPYALLLMAPLLVMVLAFAWLIVSIYAREIELAL